MELRFFQVDVFTRRLFGGNPAGVIPLDRWLDDAVMQRIARENNLSETAFFVSEGNHYGLRWFTPTVEVSLCGHGTLASAFVLFNELELGRTEICFETLSGLLSVAQDGDRILMDFPAWVLEPVDKIPKALVEGIGMIPMEVFITSSKDNLFAILRDEAQVRSVQPRLECLETLHPAGVVITAQGENSDCASRYFAPSYGIPEDPGTGSIHCGLVPFWGERLRKKEIYACQMSSRGAELYCEHRGDRVIIGGEAVKYLEGRIIL